MMTIQIMEHQYREKYDENQMVEFSYFPVIQEIHFSNPHAYSHIDKYRQYSL